MLFQNAVRLLKDKETINIYLSIYLSIYLYLREQAKAEICDTFYCAIEPQNLSDFMMNLIEDLIMLQFCWSLNLPLP